MKHVMSMSLLSLCVCFLAACTADDGLITRDGEREILLELPVLAPGMVQSGDVPSVRSTKVDYEKTINNNKVWVIQFEGTAATSKVKKAKEVTLSNGSVTFPFSLTSGSCRIYVLANVTLTGVTENSTTLQDFEAKTVAYPATVSPLTGGLPMCVYKDFDLSTVSETNPLPQFKLQAMVAKLTLNYTIDAAAQAEFGTTMTVTLKNIASGAVYKAPTVFTAALRPAGLTFTSSKELGKDVSSTAKFTSTVYVPENIAGQTSDLTGVTQRSASKAQQLSSTYYEVTADSQDGNSKITVALCLGDPSNANDFNVRRNYAYKMDVTVLGLDDVDQRLSVKGDFLYANGNSAGWTDYTKADDTFGN